MKYGVVSDLHCHNWDLFSRTLPSGVNSRLQAILDELLRAAQAVKDVHGNLLVVAGDVFHRRGVLDPEVLNPVRDAFHTIAKMGLTVIILPGNHDLKTRDTNKLASAVENLNFKCPEGKIHVLNEPIMTKINGATLGFVPWREEVDDLMADLKELAKKPQAKECDVFIHAGIDGVIKDMPAGKLPPGKLAALGFKRVFAGHYHNHKDLGDGIYSIGATTHHTWRDVGSNAGFLLVEDNSVDFHATEAPCFIDISGMAEEDMELEVPGQYARFRGSQMSQSHLDEFRKQLKIWGALGVSIEVPKATTLSRTPRPAGMTLDQSVTAFVDDDKTIPAHVDREEVKKRSQSVLDAVRSVEVVE